MIQGNTGRGVPLVSAEATFPGPGAANKWEARIFVLDSTYRAITFSPTSTPAEITARLLAPSGMSVMALEIGSSAFEVLLPDDKLRDCFKRWGAARAQRMRLVLPIWEWPRQDVVLGGLGDSADASVVVSELRRQLALLRESNRALADAKHLNDITLRVGIARPHDAMRSSSGGGSSGGGGIAAVPAPPQLQAPETTAPEVRSAGASSQAQSDLASDGTKRVRRLLFGRVLGSSHLQLETAHVCWQGWLQKRGGRRAVSSDWQPRWCILTVAGSLSSLEYYKLPTDPPSQVSPLGCCPLVPAARRTCWCDP